jgi:hypothetical protein
VTDRCGHSMPGLVSQLTSALRDGAGPSALGACVPRSGARRLADHLTHFRRRALNNGSRLQIAQIAHCVAHCRSRTIAHGRQLMPARLPIYRPSTRTNTVELTGFESVTSWLQIRSRAIP